MQFIFGLRQKNYTVKLQKYYLRRVLTVSCYIVDNTLIKLIEHRSTRIKTLVDTTTFLCRLVTIEIISVKVQLITQTALKLYTGIYF